MATCCCWTTGPECCMRRGMLRVVYPAPRPPLPTYPDPGITEATPRLLAKRARWHARWWALREALGL